MSEDKKVKRLVSEIFNESIEKEIVAKIQERINSIDLSKLIEDKISSKLNEVLGQVTKLAKDTCEEQIPIVVDDKVFSEEFHNFVEKHVQSYVESEIKKKNLDSLILTKVYDAFRDQKNNGLFIDNSISYKSINFDGFQISANAINGGEFKEFNSAGIQDSAKECQVTITDDTTIIENTLTASEIVVIDKLTVGKNLEIQGNVTFSETVMNELTNYTMDSLFNKRQDELSQKIIGSVGSMKFDAKNLSVNGENVLEDGKLANSITESNLQKLGQLKNLNVSGESLIADSLYITKGRIGINTTQPSAALSVWDQEVEMIHKKISKNTGFIGTERNVNLVLGCNNKNNITMGVDGSVSVDDLNISTIKLSVSSKEPTYIGKVGDIVLNSKPNENTPTGWQCFGGTRWKHFNW